MNDVFLTADTHLGHSRIIQYCNRPFSSHEEMDEAIIERFNSVVKKGDRLYHLGDVAWSSYPVDNFFGRLNTKQVYLVKGNHDGDFTQHPNIVKTWDLQRLKMPGRHAWLCHYAMRSWEGKRDGVYQLYGHSHGTLPGEGRQMDVGVDTNNFYPYSWEQIKERLEKVGVCGPE